MKADLYAVLNCVQNNEMETAEKILRELIEWSGDKESVLAC